MRTEAIKKLLILGARALAPEVADLVSEIPGYEVTGFVENLERERCSETIDDLPIHWIDDVAVFAPTHWAVCALSTNKRIRYIQQAAALGFRFATLIHPGARISRRSTVGEGSIVWPGVQVASSSQIGRYAVVNRGALIGHNTEIGDCVTIAPGANIAGFCRIGAGCWVGMGSIIAERTSIGEGSVTAAGAVVNRDVPAHVMVAGMPAVTVKHNIDGL